MMLSFENNYKELSFSCKILYGSVGEIQDVIFKARLLQLVFGLKHCDKSDLVFLSLC